jgi:hypothetical protein
MRSRDNTDQAVGIARASLDLVNQPIENARITKPEKAVEGAAERV